MSLEPEPIPLDVKVVLIGDRLLYYLLMRSSIPTSRSCSRWRSISTTRSTARESRLQIVRAADRDAARASSAAAVRARRGRPGDRAQRAPRRRSGQAHRRISAASPISCARPTTGPAKPRRRRSHGRRRAARDRRAHLPRSDRMRERPQEADRPRHDADRHRAARRSARSTACRCCSSAIRASAGRRRITARVRLGRGEVVDIEREVELGGPIHSKGVLILSGFLGAPLCARPAAVAGAPAWSSSSPTAASTATAPPRPSSMRCCRRSPSVPIRQSLRGHRLGQPARPGAGDRRGQREDRRLLRHLRARAA